MGATEEYLIHVLHHELNHNVDFAHYGNTRAFLQDWNSLNTSGFVYGNGGADAYANNGVPWAALTNPVPGFIDLYSMLGQEEDRSEFAALILGTQNENSILKNMCAQDPIIATKTKLMISILDEFWPFAEKDTYWTLNNAGTACD